MNKIYFIMPILIFIIFSILTFYQTSNIKSEINNWKKLSIKAKRVEKVFFYKKNELLEIDKKFKRLHKKQTEINANFRMLAKNYSQNNFRNEVDSQSQRFGLLIEEFIFNKTQRKNIGIVKDQFSLKLKGNYLDFIRFIYIMAKKFNNFDIESVSFSRNTAYEKKVTVSIKGILFKYVQ